MSQSLVNESAGARTPLSGLVAALFTLIVVLFASGLLRNLPQPVLAAIVLAAVMSLVDVAALRHIWHFSRTEFVVAMVALPRRARIRAGQRRAARRRDLDRAAAPAGRAPAGDRARAGAGHDVLRRSVASSGRRTDARRRWSSAANRRCCTSTWSTCASGCSSCSTRAHGSGAARRLLSSARCRRSISPGPSSSPICTRRFVRAASAFRLADAHGEVREALGGSGSTRSTVRSRPGRPSIS